MAALRPGASPPPVRTPMRTTPSVIGLRRAAAARGQIEDEQEGAHRDDDHPEDDTRGAVELIAADADDALEEGGAQAEEHQRDDHPPRPGTPAPRRTPSSRSDWWHPGTAG